VPLPPWVEDLAADRDALLRDMADMVPEALDGLSGEERHRVYWMLRMEVTPIPEDFRASGALSDDFRSFGPKGRGR
jgi:hypothetical protein